MNGKLATLSIAVISLFIAAINHVVFNDSQYKPVLLILSLLAVLPYYTSHGSRRAVTTELWLMATSVIFSTAVLMLCEVSEFFRPYTAVVIATGMFLGAPAGFICGYFSALIISLITGVGGWTVYQVIILSLIGYVAGLTGRRFAASNTAIIIFSMIASVMYSSVCIMSLTWDAGKGFEFSELPKMILHSVKWFEIYSISDIVTLIIIKNLLYKKTLRIKKRFRIFEYGRKRVR